MERNRPSGRVGSVRTSPRARRQPRRTREKANVHVPLAPLTGDELLEAVTDSMVVLHQRDHHRAPVTAKTLLLGDDLLACVMGGAYSDVEKTLIVGPDMEIELFMLTPPELPPARRDGQPSL